MQRATLIYLTVILIAILTFSAILPYPVFSPYTNITSQDAYEINNYFETEISNSSSQKDKLLDVDWFSCINYLLPLDIEIELVDINSNTTLLAKRIGGTNHADIEFDEENLQTLKSLKENWSWTRRPMLLKLNENTYLPASLACYPHGYCDQSKLGHFCLHFKNSKTHGTNRIDLKHQKNIETSSESFKAFVQ